MAMNYRLNDYLRTLKYKIILVVFVFYFSSCVAFPIENITPQMRLNEDEGILITKIRTNIEDSYILIHSKHNKWPIAKFKPVNPYEDLRVVIVRSGELYFSKVGRGDGFVWGPRNYFTVMPGTITYVGDLVVEWVAEKEGIVAYVTTIDREERTVKEAREKYPWVFKVYPYQKSLSNNN
jgi:hypothetical protein